MKQHRLENIDFIRGLVMILVVLDHSGFPNRNVILGFRMPILFILSGFLNYRKDFWGKTKKTF